MRVAEHALHERAKKMNASPTIVKRAEENGVKKRLGIYLFNGAEVLDWAGPAGVFAVARRMDPELDAFLVGDSLVPVMTTASLSVNPRYGLDQRPDMDAFLIPGGIGTRAKRSSPSTGWRKSPPRP